MSGHEFLAQAKRLGLFTEFTAEESADKSIFYQIVNSRDRFQLLAMIDKHSEGASSALADALAVLRRFVNYDPIDGEVLELLNDARKGSLLAKAKMVKLLTFDPELVPKDWQEEVIGWLNHFLQDREANKASLEFIGRNLRYAGGYLTGFGVQDVDEIVKSYRLKYAKDEREQSNEVVYEHLHYYTVDGMRDLVYGLSQAMASMLLKDSDFSPIHILGGTQGCRARMSILSSPSEVWLRCYINVGLVFNLCVRRAEVSRLAEFIESVAGWVNLTFLEASVIELALKELDMNLEAARLD